MNVLAIDTATERCSVALRTPGTTYERSVSSARSHAELILPMVREVLDESGLILADLDGIRTIRVNESASDPASLVDAVASRLMSHGAAELLASAR